MKYETVFILTPVLSDVQMKEAVAKFADVLKAEGATIVNEELWGLRKLAIPSPRSRPASTASSNSTPTRPSSRSLKQLSVATSA